MASLTERAGAPAGRRPVAPATIVVGLLIAFCALLLLKWLAVVALAALALAALVRWARRDPTAARVTVPAGRDDAVEPARPEPAPPEPACPVAPRRPTEDDCSWCGLPGGHRDVRGHAVRPRHVHPFA